MTPVEALEVLRREHTPYVPVIVSVLDCELDEDWREPTIFEQAESELWCDGCNRAASRCAVASLLALVDLETADAVENNPAGVPPSLLRRLRTRLRPARRRRSPTPHTCLPLPES